MQLIAAVGEIVPINRKPDFNYAIKLEKAPINQVEILNSNYDCYFNIAINFNRN